MSNDSNDNSANSSNLANMVQERKVWLEAHGAMEGIQEGAYQIKAELVDQRHLENLQLTPNSKLIHFQRHAQGYHNLIFRILEENGLPITDIYNPDPAVNPFVKPEIRDSPLTELGRSQCLEQRIKVEKLGIKPELVIVSPMHRALLTALLTFSQPPRDHDTTHNDTHSDTHNENENDAGPSFVAHSGCREELGILTCNWRRPLSETQIEFPQVDFGSLLATEGDEDSLFNLTEQENPTHQSQRIYDFLVDYLRVQPQSEIAVVGHSAWLFTMCNAVIDCGDDEELTSWFGTSEIRSMILTWETTKRGDE
ncbi:unnamed protein product [Cylindrotheca closterium]|uniref:Phosphoglycerate mutase family protein n=1 Tax=Cylindrotheca closterium TaxID=2856 RepID=A0AAD2G110_9STRA|nr:unnamed protein product [Cylindrotheca closterium]